MELLKLSVCMIRHPADTLKAIKAHRSNMSIIPMLVLLLLVVATRFASLFIIHYPFQQTAVSDINFFLEGAIYTVPVLTWGIAFFAMTSTMDGETTLKESLTSASFCMVPLILMQIPFALLTRIMSLDETFFYDLIQIAMWAWVLLLFVMSVKVMNDYSLSKTIWICILNLLSIALIWAIVLLVYALASQLFQFIAGMIKEIRYALFKS